jgi:hypothetical protein
MSRIPNSSVRASHLLVEARLGHDPLGVAEDRLDDDRGDLSPALEQCAQRSMRL